jgi:hypothetical protein
MPAITVLIDTYNHERFIEQALVSVLEQDFPSSDLEILVVDDGSTDRTSEIIRKFEGPRVRLIRKPNGGQVSAFNTGVAAAQGEIVAFLDGDDWWAPNKLTEVARAFEANPNVAAVGHGYYEVYESAAPQEIVAPEKTCLLDLSSPEAALLADAGATFLVTSRLSARKRTLDRIGPLPPEAVFFDTLVFTLSFALGGALILKDPLCYYRHHAQSLHNPLELDAATQRRRMEALNFRLNYLPARLAEFAVPKNIVDTFMEARRVEYQRTMTMLQAGHQSSRINVFRAEMRRFRSAYKRPSFGYRLFQCAVGACALLLPPRSFYRLFDWYSRNDIKRFRGILGKPEPKVSQDFAQRQVLPGPAENQPSTKTPHEGVSHIVR